MESDFDSLQRMVEIADLRSKGIQDTHFLNWTFQAVEDTPYVQMAKRYVNQWEQVKEKKPGLLFWGDVGTGKSFLAACIANALLSQGVTVMMTNFPRVLTRMGDLQFGERSEYIASFGKFDLLIIDDLGVERNSEYTLEQVYAVIDERYKSNLPLIVTTNLTPKQLGSAHDVAHARIYSRKGDPIELAVVTAAFYGLRRSEVLGLRWTAIDFEKKTITIKHTIQEAKVDGKYQIVASDRTKTKSSYRMLPLVAPYEEVLLRFKATQAENRRLCGSYYCQDYLDYIFVNEIGEILKPGYLSSHFVSVIKKHEMPRLRFHDLRHSCATLLFAQGVPMKEIQAWLGHSTIGTTANTYTHLDENSKVNSANAIISILPQKSGIQGD